MPAATRTLLKSRARVDENEVKLETRPNDRLHAHGQLSCRLETVVTRWDTRS